MLAERTFARRRSVLKAFATASAVAALALGPALVPVAAMGADAPATPRLAIVAPLVVPAGITGLISTVQLAQYTGPSGLLTRELDAVIDRQVTIAIDPMIIASIRVLGSDAPPSAITWLDRLASAPNQSFALAYADVDLAALSQSGNSTDLAPQSFDFAVDRTLFAPQVTVAPTATPTPAPDTSGLPAFPTTESLLAWPYSITGLAWPREGTVVASDLAALATGGATTSILSSSNVSTDKSSSTVDIGGSRVVVSDAAVSTALRDAASATSDEEWQARMAVLRTALTASAAAQGGQPTIVVTLDRLAPPTSSRLGQTLQQLSSEGSTTSIPLSSVIAATPITASIIDQPLPEQVVGVAGRMLGAEHSEQAFASVASEPLSLTAPRRLELAALLANQWRTNPTGSAVDTDDFLTESQTLVSSVQIVPNSGFNLFADRPSELPITVSNNLDQQVTVYITVRPDTALLAVTNSHVKLVIEPNSQGKGQVPVQAISNGTVSLTVSLSSVSRVPVGDAIRTKINVQAGWETPIVVIFAALVVALFAVGIVRSILRRRRAQ